MKWTLAVILIVSLLNWIWSVDIMGSFEASNPKVVQSSEALRDSTDDKRFFDNELVLDVTGLNFSVFQVFAEYGRKTEEVRQVLLKAAPIKRYNYYEQCICF